MELVRELTRDDILQVADLHQRLRFNRTDAASEQLQRYYCNIFFDSPWADSELPSLVCCNVEGKVVGFIGALSRRMVYEGQPLRVAVAHRFMVDSQQASPFAAARLMKRFLSGPQDLSLSDGANDLGRQFWEGSGGVTCWLYSMNWLKIFRPVSYAVYLGLKKTPSFCSILTPVMDVSSCLSKSIIAPLKKRQTSTKLHEEQMTQDKFIECMNQFPKSYSLSPVYEKKELEWMWTFLKDNMHRGLLKGSVFNLSSGMLAGCCLYYLKPGKRIEVILLASRKEHRDEVFRYQQNLFRQQNIVSATGRIEPLFMPAMWEDRCIVKRGSWAMVHSRDTHLLEAINSGRAFISCLEGELWLRSPMDRL